MNKFLIVFAFLLLTISCNDKIERSKILFITTNIDEMKGEANGTYLIEFAVPFAQFLESGYEIDIVSPNGGKIPIYHSGDTSVLVKSIVENKVFDDKTGNSLKPAAVNPEEYLAVIIPGGYGQFWDTHKNTEILRTISDIYESGGAIGTIGHGTATLIDVKLKSGEYLVKDKTMTSFPTWNEKNIMSQSNYGKLLPYDMETELLNRGANLKIYNHEKGINYEVVDVENRIVTASFANSGKFIAEQVLKLIDKEK